MEGVFRFKQFEVRNEASALKVGTDAVVLGASMTLKPSDARLLDIGTGTGVIALMAAQRLSELAGESPAGQFMIEAIDIDGPSADEAAGNFAASVWSAHLKAVHSALSDYAAGEYDLIFSNPPYYDNSLTNPDARETAARHTGALSYRDICAFAARSLAPEGRLSLILPYDALTSLRRTAASFGLYPFRLIAVRTTPAKAPRRLVAEFSRTRADVQEETLTLQEGQSRTEEYAALTRAFYL